MGFRINRGIFQFKDTASDTFINKFKIDDRGDMVEVDPDGNAVTAYMKVGDKATDADKLDGVNSSQFLRSDADDNVTGHTEWQDSKNIRLGNSADFRMWFDGSHTYFRNYNHGNGNIYFQGEDTAGANHALLYMFTANTRPYVSLYEDGGERFKTTSAGVEVLGDAYINQGRIHIKRGTGLTHTEWEDDSSANGRAQLILDSHYSDLIIASRNSNSNKHGSTLTFATQSTSTNDVAKWVIGQGQYQEGANHLAFAYSTNQTNPHSILGTDNANADFVIMDGGKVVIGGTVDKNAYNSTPSTRLMFGGANSDAEGNYYIGTNKEDYGGNYTKLDLRWHTGIRMGAQAGYGGIRMYDSEDLGTVIFSVGQGDANVRVKNSLYILGSTNSGRFYADDWGIKVGTDSGHIQFGAANTTWAHIYTDRPNFYFNKNIYVNNAILSTRSWAQGVADTAESNAITHADTRINDEVLPLVNDIGNAVDTNRTEITNLGTAIPTNNNQLTNGAGYITDLPDAGVGAGTYGSTSNQTKIDTITVDAKGRVTAVATGTGGDITTVRLVDDAGSYVQDTGGTAVLTIAGGAGITTSASGTTITVANDEAGVNSRIDEEVLPAVSENADSITSNRAEITALGSNKLDKTAKAADSNLLDGKDSGLFFRRQSAANGTAGAGWITVATCGSGRYSGEVYVTDGESSDHAFIRIHWMRSYQDSNFTVLNCGGHGNRITGARVLYQTSDNTYGVKLLQVYVTTSSNYYVRIHQEGDTPNFSTPAAVTPVVENTKSGYALHGTELTNLDAVSLAAEEGIRVGGTAYINGINSTGGDIQNNKGSYLHLGGWAVSRTHASAVLVNTAYRADYATSLFNENISRFTNDANYLTQDALTEVEEGLRAEINTAQTTADSKLGATAKAADANKLDGYDWMQSGKNVRGSEFYADNWFRNYNSGEGIYNQATAVHWYSDSTARWRHRSGSSSESWILMCTSNNAARGSFYANSSNQVGILDADNHWAVRVVHDSYVEFRDNNEVTFRVGQGGVSGNYGTVQTHGNGKGGYEGYSINGRFVWMSPDSGFSGIYNDTDNEWMTIWRRNGSTELHHNGSKKLETTSSGATVTGTMTATAFSGSGANLTNLPIPDQRTRATLNGEPAGVIVSVNFNLDRGTIEFTLENGEIINGAIAR